MSKYAVHVPKTALGMTLTVTIITVLNEPVCSSNLTALSWNYNYCIAVLLCVAKHLMKLYLIVNTMLKRAK